MKPALSALLLAAGCNAPMPEIIAHRGASVDAPENTLAAFRLGWVQADANELDVHLSQDGRLIVIHDASTKRTAGLDKPVVQQTLAGLKTLDAGRGERLPTLEEVLEGMPPDKRLFIEIKCGPEALPELQRVLTPSKQLVLIGFSIETMSAAKKRFPSLEVCWLQGYKEDKKSGRFPDLDDLITRCRAAGLDGLDLDHKFPVDAAFVGRVHAAGLKLYTWTLNDEAAARRHAAAGVDGITTDRPAWLRSLLTPR